KGWFVMMKDSKNSHPDNKLWGDGWGWSWFDSAPPSKTPSTNYKVDCQSCHVPARASDWIYVQGYPALKKWHWLTRGGEIAMPQPERIETLILGSGNGGMYLARHMARSGRRTAVVERRWIGGSWPKIQ